MRAEGAAAPISVSHKLGKLSRSTLHLLFDELRHTSGSASVEASWGVLSCALRYAYGQRREDLFLLPLLLNALRSEPTGRAQTFVELGALDGMSMSNTAHSIHVGTGTIKAEHIRWHCGMSMSNTT